MPTAPADPARARHRRGLALMLGSAACFTANVLLIRGAAQIETVDIWFVSCLRFVIGLGVVVAVYGRDWQPAHLFRRRKLAERGLFGGLGVAGYYVTVVELGAGRATFINNTYLVWGALIAVFVLRERFHGSLAAGSVAALGGLALLTGAFAGSSAFGVYDALAVLTAIGSGYIVVTIRQLHATEHSATIFSAQCVYGLLVCGVPAVLHLQPVGGAAFALLAVASVGAGVGQLLMTRAFRDLSVAEGSLLQMTVPIGIAVGEAALFSARFTGAELAGAVLILAGCALPVLRRS